MADSPIVTHLQQQLETAVKALVEIRKGGSKRPWHYVEIADVAIKTLVENPEPMAGTPQAGASNEAMVNAIDRVEKFAQVWDQLKPSPEVYGLETGHPERECSLSKADMLALVAEVKAWRFRFPDLAFTDRLDGIQPK